MSDVIREMEVVNIYVVLIQVRERKSDYKVGNGEHNFIYFWMQFWEG